MGAASTVGIIVLILILWYLLMMIFATVFAKQYESTRLDKWKTANSICRVASLFNCPFVKLNELSTIDSTSFEPEDLSSPVTPLTTGGEYIPEGPDY